MMSEKDRLRREYYRRKAVKAMDAWNETHPIWEQIEDYSAFLVEWAEKHEDDVMQEKGEVGESIPVPEPVKEALDEAFEDAEEGRAEVLEAETVEEAMAEPEPEPEEEAPTELDEIAQLKARLAQLEKAERDGNDKDTDE